MRIEGLFDIVNKEIMIDLGEEIQRCVACQIRESVTYACS